MLYRSTIRPNVASSARAPARFDYAVFWALNMAEREALQKEIEELQNLIKDHKRVHGDGPSSSAPWFSAGRGLGRGRGHNPHNTHSYSGQAQTFAPRHPSQWRKTYSLNNKTTTALGGGPSQASAPYLNKTQHVSSAVSVAGSLADSQKPSGVCKLKETTEAQTIKSCTAPLQSIGKKELPLSGDIISATSANRTVLKPTTSKTETEVSSKTVLAGSSTTNELTQQSECEKRTNLTDTSKSASHMVCGTATSSATSCAFKNTTTSAPLQAKPHLTSTISTNRSVIIATAVKDFSSTLETTPPRASSSSALSHRIKLDSTAHVLTKPSVLKTSQFTWVKSQGTTISQPKPQIHAGIDSSSNSKPTVASGSAVTGIANVKHDHGSNKKGHRRPSLTSGSPRASKYSWVSSSCSRGTLTKQPNKQPSPKALKLPGKVTKEGSDGTKKFTSSSSTMSKRTKTSGGTSTSHSSHGNSNASRYSWKAPAQSSSVVSVGSTPRSSRKGSVYRWTAQKEGKDSGFGSITSRVQHSPVTTPPSSSGFKLRSRTKIIRRCTSSPAPERKSGPSVVTVRSRYSLRRRTHTPARTPTGSRRGHSRMLVSFGRHKLRRLTASSPTTAAWTTRTGFSPLSGRSSVPHRVIKTRYKIDTRRAHLQHHNPALSYRVKRIQSARSLLQSRLRSPPDRQWRGRGMRWIGGALYRVSANKLSRTQTTSTSSARSAKWFSSQEVSSSSGVRTSSMRHVASRAVQRSLAIIRQAHQKKQQAKQYCMYYNRFGKCNRGSSCPYIHDPDKVAVCTRFLRGTCKQTDGTCPFSHKVSKEKMPVCSYFLKGICNNSSCPYSHVYVSRKADVCQDFIRGYCPQGEKCKKKHTLVCPEFSRTGACPKGSKCKLQHRQRAKRTGSSLTSGPGKKARTKRTESETSLSESTEADECTARSGLSKLPSFISLSSSPDTPETADSPPCPPVAGTEATGTAEGGADSLTDGGLEERNCKSSLASRKFQNCGTFLTHS
ncbi:zinc finger CCCH domain-containing protein 3 [Astyanax mexicanus]|uniref:Zinc finger CCCH domain-containing protein 3 n=1 Tax=Astyanax mexicanus TaxID=7994 RepID=A0A8T2M2T1_ASTMX|nr:zinc finger CCCH domain-containing protein 3 [Astyanax mexicanus]